MYKWYLDVILSRTYDFIMWSNVKSLNLTEFYYGKRKNFSFRVLWLVVYTEYDNLQITIIK